MADAGAPPGLAGEATATEEVATNWEEEADVAKGAGEDKKVDEQQLTAAEECVADQTPDGPETGSEGADESEDPGVESGLSRLSKASKIPAMDDRPHLNIVFIGHVDAGKSTTCGNILFLTGQVESRVMEKYEREAKEKNRESWFLAFIMDINEEERQKGKTVEVGRALFDTPNRRFTILDAPGHKSFVPNMISGAAQADIGVLIISARKGEFETGFERGGQTREHAMLAKTLGVGQLVVAINKMDDPTCEWSESRFRDIEQKMSPFLRSCGYNPAKDVYYVPISGLTGANIKDSVAVPGSPVYCEAGSWYGTEAPTLLGLLDNLEPPSRSASDPLRIPLLEGYKDQGVMASGKIEAGSVAAGDSAMLMPGRTKVKISAVIVNDQEVQKALPGENVALRLLGVEEDSITKGSVLSALADPCPVVRKAKCQVVIVRLPEHKPIVSPGFKCVMHAHTMMQEVSMEKLFEAVDKATRKKKVNPKFATSGSVVVCEIEMSMAACMETFSLRPQLGRFTLRDEGLTIGIGKIIEITQTD